MPPHGRPVGTAFKPEQSGNPAGRKSVPGIAIHIKRILEGDEPRPNSVVGAIATASGEVASGSME